MLEHDLEPGADATLLAPTTWDLEDILGVVVGTARLQRQRRRVLLDKDDLSVRADEDHVERDVGVFHPELERLRLLEQKQHAVPRLKRLAIHETARALRLGARQLDGDAELRPASASQQHRRLDGALSRAWWRSVTAAAHRDRHQQPVLKRAHPTRIARRASSCKARYSRTAMTVSLIGIDAGELALCPRRASQLLASADVVVASAEELVLGWVSLAPRAKLIVEPDAVRRQLVAAEASRDGQRVVWLEVAPDRTWFERGMVTELVPATHGPWLRPPQPLDGMRVLLLGTRQPTVAQIEEYLGGADTLALSPMVVVPCHAALKEAIARLSSVRTIAFASGHAVDAFVAALIDRGLDARALAGLRLAAVGAATAARLAERSLRADLVGEKGGAALADELVAAGWEGPVLLPSATDARPELAAALGAAGLEVVRVDAYQTIVDEGALGRAARCHRRAPYHAVAIMSPRGGEALLEALGGAVALAHTAVIAVGETTRATLTRAGVAHLTVAPMPAWAEVLQAVAEALAPANKIE